MIVDEENDDSGTSLRKMSKSDESEDGQFGKTEDLSKVLAAGDS